MKILTVSAFCVMMLAAGCKTHSYGTAMSGYGLWIRWSTESMIPEMALGYFTSSSAALRDNASFEYAPGMSFNGISGGGKTNGVAGFTAESMMKMKTGESSVSYAVDGVILGIPVF